MKVNFADKSEFMALSIRCHIKIIQWSVYLFHCYTDYKRERKKDVNYGGRIRRVYDISAPPHRSCQLAMDMSPYSPWRSHLGTTISAQEKSPWETHHRTIWCAPAAPHGDREMYERHVPPVMALCCQCTRGVSCPFLFPFKGSWGEKWLNAA